MANSEGDEKTQINIVVRKDRKSEWSDYAEREHGSLSQLIRSSVETEMADGSGGSESVPDDLAETMEAIRESNERVERELHGLRRRVENIETAVGEPPEDVRDLANRVLDVIPQSQDGAKKVRRTIEESGSVPDSRLGQVPPATVEDIGRFLDEPEYRVDDALELLEEDTYMVRSIRGEEGTRYYYAEG